jgi:hypothetical protein
MVSYQLTIYNTGPVAASFKFQTSMVTDAAQDNMAAIMMSTLAGGSSPNAVMWFNKHGLFSGSFADLAVSVNSADASTSPITVVPGGQVTVDFSTLAPFVQLQPTTANSASLLIDGATSGKVALFSDGELTSFNIADNAPGGLFTLVTGSPSDEAGAIDLPVPTTIPTTPTTPAAGFAHTVSGSIAAGCSWITFIASADFSGTLLGEPLAAGAGLTIPAPVGGTLGTLPFTVSAGTLYTVEVRP